MKKIVLIIVLLGLYAVNAFAEETGSKAIDDLKNYKITFGKGENDATEFIFTRKEDNEVINTFNIVTNAPYQDLDFPIIEKRNGFNVYDLSAVPKEQALDFFNVLESKREAFRFDRAYTLYACRISEDHAVVCYSLYADSDYKFSMAAKATAIVFNTKGEETFRLDNIDFDCFEPVITDDGKYFAFQQGVIIQERDDSGVTEPTVVIYDTVTGQMIVNRKIDEGYGEILGPVIDIDKIGVSFENSKNVKFIEFDCNKRVVYSKIYPRGMCYSTSLQDITKEGFIWDIPDSGIRIDRFEEDFDKEDF